MPLQDGLLIAVKDGVVELTANLVEPHGDDPASFTEALQQRLAEHQHQAMTDDTIMGDELALASCIVCRDPIPDALKDPLLGLGFAPEDTPPGGQQPRSLFGRLGSSKQRSRLEKWTLRYHRSDELDPRLAAFEAALVDEVPAGALPEVALEGAHRVIDGARTYLQLLLAPGLAGLEALERQLDQLRRAKSGRWILHARAVRGLAGFTVQSIAAEAPDTQWGPDEDDSPLWVRAPHGITVATDPEYRTVEFIRRGLRASLSDYVRDVLRQSKNH